MTLGGFEPVGERLEGVTDAVCSARGVGAGEVGVEILVDVEDLRVGLVGMIGRGEGETYLGWWYCRLGSSRRRERQPNHLRRRLKRRCSRCLEGESFARKLQRHVWPLQRLGQLQPRS